MKERPILFKGVMVRAILAGIKTQTRRVIKPQPEYYNGAWLFREGIYHGDDDMKEHLFHNVYGKHGTPYGSVYADGTGDRLWVRETFAYVDWQDKPIYAADCSVTDLNNAPFKWTPSIFMKREASRITLELTDVRVQRLQEISEDDAKAEGVGNVAEYKNLWNDINYKRGYSWDINPFVWAINKKVVTK